MYKFLFGFLLGFSGVFVSVPVLAEVSVETVNDMISADGSYYDKIDNFSKLFVDTEYLLDPLGEENELDPDPFYRFDAFDGVTYVETVLALAQADDFDDFLKRKRYISYRKGRVDFEERNHFFELDFVNNNSDLIDDETEELGVSTVLITREINKKSWFKQMFDIKKSERVKEVSLKYIPFDANLLSIETNFDGPAIVSIVLDNPDMVDKIGSNILTGHIGLLFKTDNGLVIRHASQDDEKVVEEKWSDFIEKIKVNPEFVGYKIYQLVNYSEKK